jgi:hypothetical protein
MTTLCGSEETAMLKQNLAIFLAALVAVSQAKAQQAGASARTVKVPHETALRFATVQPLTSASAKSGDDVPLRLVEPLLVNGVILLPEGTVVHGRITKVKHAKASCRNGEIEWKLDRIFFSDGSSVPAEVGFVSPEPAAQLPKDIPVSKRLGPAFWIFAFPFILAVTAPFLVLMLPFFAAQSWDQRCPGQGNDYVLPANATVAVVTRHEHKVRYEGPVGAP